jgi:uncharacterized protein YnzC (UPF0291/DUF896 family)
MDQQLEFAASQFDLLSQPELRAKYFDAIREQFMRSTGLSLVDGNLTRQPESVNIAIPDKTSKLTPDDEQTRAYLSNYFVEKLTEQVRKHSIRELREYGVLIEGERKGLTWLVTASVRY